MALKQQASTAPKMGGPAKRDLYVDSHGHSKEQPISVYPVQSARVPKFGNPTVYTVCLYEDGCLSCNCPAWTMWAKKKQGKPRDCKHVLGVNPIMREIHKQFKRGEALPVFDMEAAKNAPPVLLKAGGTTSDHDFGRMVVID